MMLGGIPLRNLPGMTLQPTRTPRKTSTPGAYVFLGNLPKNPNSPAKSEPKPLPIDPNLLTGLAAVSAAAGATAVALLMRRRREEELEQRRQESESEAHAIANKKNRERLEEYLKRQIQNSIQFNAKDSTRDATMKANRNKPAKTKNSRDLSIANHVAEKVKNILNTTKTRISNSTGIFLSQLMANHNLAEKMTSGQDENEKKLLSFRPVASLYGMYGIKKQENTSKEFRSDPFEVSQNEAYIKELYGYNGCPAVSACNAIVALLPKNIQTKEFKSLSLSESGDIKTYNAFSEQTCIEEIHPFLKEAGFSSIYGAQPSVLAAGVQSFVEALNKNNKFGSEYNFRITEYNIKDPLKALGTLLKIVDSPDKKAIIDVTAFEISRDNKTMTGISVGDPPPIITPTIEPDNCNLRQCLIDYPSVNGNGRLISHFVNPISVTIDPSNGFHMEVSESMHQPMIDPEKPQPDLITFFRAWYNPEVRAMEARHEGFNTMLKRSVKEILGQDKLPKPEKVDYWLLEIERVEGINEN